MGQKLNDVAQVTEFMNNPRMCAYWIDVRLVKYWWYTKVA